VKSSLSPHAWHVLGRSALERGQLEQLLAEFTDGERRAFWSAVLLLDDRASIGEVLRGWRRLSTATPGVDAGAVVLPFGPKVCGQCGEPLPAPDPPGGNPRQYHEHCRDAVRARRKREARARSNGRSTATAPVSS
jgi:hypothetical protein